MNSVKEDDIVTHVSEDESYVFAETPIRPYYQNPNVVTKN